MRRGDRVRIKDEEVLTRELRGMRGKVTSVETRSGVIMVKIKCDGVWETFLDDKVHTHATLPIRFVEIEE